MFCQTFSGRKVFVTGHTGFKGAWLTQWLLLLGAEVTGFSLDPPTSPSLYEELQLDSRIRSIHGDVRDLAKLKRELLDCRPDFVFHMAAQSLVRFSYQEPVETFATNTMGTIHVLEALRELDNLCVAVIVTTDKVYRNREWFYGYRENDELGGSDPYSCSKAMADLAVECYRRSWFSGMSENPPHIRIACVRAGNVIGGGDWALDRIIPDSVRALSCNEPIVIRNRYARRPWQHVLDPLHGYLVLASKLRMAIEPHHIETLCSSFNFGPPSDSNRTVGELVDAVLKLWPGKSLEKKDVNAPHESTLLHLCTDKANSILQWQCLWDFSVSIAKTIEWYRQVQSGSSSSLVTIEQIRHFEACCTNSHW